MVWITLDRCESIWMDLEPSGLLWTDLDHSGVFLGVRVVGFKESIEGTQGGLECESAGDGALMRSVEADDQSD